MENVKRNLYLKLSNLVDKELDSDNPDLDLVEECVDGMLRLMPEETYQITAQQRQGNIQQILNNIPQKKKLSKVAKALLAAAIIMILLIGSVFAYTIIEYHIHDYDTYSKVWTNMIMKNTVTPSFEIGYLPEGFELVETESNSFSYTETYKNTDEIIITFSKIANTHVSINTEFEKIREYSINETNYIIFGEETHGKGILWFENGYQFGIGGSLNDDELLKIAQNVS